MTAFPAIMFIMSGLLGCGVWCSLTGGQSSAYDKRPDDPPRDWQSAAFYFLGAAITAWVGWAAL